MIACMRVVATAAILSTLLTIPACGSDEPNSPPAASTADPERAGGTLYLAHPDGQWVLKDANNLSPGTNVSVEPSLDWYAEYEAPPANSPRRVRLSGHHGDLDGVSAELRGFTLAPSTVASYAAVSGTSPDPDGRPAVVLFSVRADYSVMALSYELTVEELRLWAEDLTVVTESEWVQAGGEIER